MRHFTSQVVEHPQGVGERRGIRRRRTRADRGDIIIGVVDVRDRQRQHPPGRCRQPSALDGRQMLPHAIELADVRSRSQQRRDRPALLIERDPVDGDGHHRRCAA